jgi:hypothetical protein
VKLWVGWCPGNDKFGRVIIILFEALKLMDFGLLTKKGGYSMQV